MDKEFHDIDRIFKSAIDNGYRETPPPAVWDTIDHALESKKYEQIERKYRNLKRLTAALIVLLFGFGSFEVYHYVTSEKETIVQANNQRNTTNDDDELKTRNSAADSRDVSDKKTSITSASSNQLNPIRSKDIIINGRQVFRSNENGVHTTQQGNTTIIEDKIEGLNTGSISKAMTNHSTENAAEEKFVKSTRVLPQFLFPARGIEASVSSPLKHTSVSALTNNIKLSKFKPYFSITPIYGFENPSYRIQNEKQIIRWTGPGAGFGRVEEKEEIKNTPQKITSFSAGILADYHLSRHWSIQSGAMLSQITSITSETRKIFAIGSGPVPGMDFRYNSACGYAIVDAKFDAGGTGPLMTDTLYAKESESRLQYVTVPLNIKYALKAGRFNFYASAGVAANILLKGKLESNINDGAAKQKEINTDIYGLRNVYYSGMIGIGAEYAFSNRISLNVIPNAKMGLNSINKDGIVTSYHNSTGVMAGLRVKL